MVTNKSLTAFMTNFIGTVNSKGGRIFMIGMVTFLTAFGVGLRMFYNPPITIESLLAFLLLAVFSTTAGLAVKTKISAVNKPKEAGGLSE